ncbi:porin family protein [Niabella sp. CC-SYL272]|uniref:outer membrane beta-barrel protein n=1 Tax=Niabella agricola TaxID=2891571 RepID=UPI001F230B90|nr:outer membrane beta-barrel protein [Niabella agricola]MCF3108859.1 porin family protein [Niabella agricola]
MKTKLLTVALLTCTYFYSNAQVEKGSTLLGGQLGFTTQGDTSSKNNTNGQINIRAGKAYKDNMVFGISLGYAGAKNEMNPDVNDQKNTSYTAGIFNRCYKELGHDFYFFGEAGLGYSYGKTTWTDNLPSSQKKRSLTSSSVGLGVTPGIAYRVLDHLHMELLIPSLLAVNYSSNKLKSEGTESYKNHTFSFNTAFNRNPLESLGVGFSLIF